MDNTTSQIITWSIAAAALIFKRPVEVWWDERRELRKNTPAKLVNEKRSLAWRNFGFFFSYILPAVAVAYYITFLPLTNLVVFDIAFMTAIFFFNLLLGLISKYRLKTADRMIRLQDELLKQKEQSLEMLEMIRKTNEDQNILIGVMKLMAEGLGDVDAKLKEHLGTTGPPEGGVI
jgi:hypothetical protein